MNELRVGLKQLRQAWRLSAQRSRRRAPLVTASETQAIAEAFMLHPHRTNHIAVRADSQGALRRFATNDIPSPVHTNLAAYMQAHLHLHVFLVTTKA